MEFLDVVDESGNPTGETVSRSDAHRKGIAHHPFTIFPFDIISVTVALYIDL